MLPPAPRALVIGVANGASPTTPSVTVTLGVTSAPIISAITSASSYVETAAGTAPNAAPYDIISIFGTNLCPLCTGTNSVLVGAPDPVYYRYPTVSQPRRHTQDHCHFHQTHHHHYSARLPSLRHQQPDQRPGSGGSRVAGGTASPNVGLVNVQVGYDTATPPGRRQHISRVSDNHTLLTDPGIFTIESSGQGQGAITDATTFALNSQTAYRYFRYQHCFDLYDRPGCPRQRRNQQQRELPPVWSTSCIAPLGAVGTSSHCARWLHGNGEHSLILPLVTATGFQQPVPSYVVPSPLWTSIDGAVINPAQLALNATTPVTANFHQRPMLGQHGNIAHSHHR